MWEVTLYKDTGLNSVNTLDNPNILNASSGKIELPALDILQAEFLDNIRVKATRDQVKNADFLVLENTENENEKFFYSVESFTATSIDVQTLAVTFDALMTLEFLVNGIDKIEFLDGIVERHHVPKNNDGYGYYTENDPLLIPSKELGMRVKQFYKPVYNASGDPTDVIPKTIIQSTANLTDTSSSARKYAVAGDSDQVAIVPIPPKGVTEPTHFYFPMSDGQGPQYVNLAAKCYDYDHAGTKAGIQRLRELGLERSSITASYSMVQNFDYEVNGTSEGMPGFYNLYGKYQETEDDFFEFEYDETVNNKRVLYGNINMFEMISVASGVRMSFKPEDICLTDEGDTLRQPVICRVSDPRPEGRPYYNFKYYRGINQNTHNYFSNSVPGMVWPSVPVVYTGLSGSQLNEIRYNTEMEGLGISRQQSIEQLDYNLGEAHTRRTFDLLSGGVDTIISSVSNPANAGNSIYNYGKSILGASVDMAFEQTRAQFDKSQLEQRYAYNAKKEMQELKIANTIVAPDVHFPNAETLRDFLGNGVYVFQYRPQASDIRKLDKILTMYGYKDTKTLEGSDFSNRAKFNYVKASNVSIGGRNIPKWIREAAVNQLSAGVRVWHQLPDISVYTNGSNI